MTPTHSPRTLAQRMNDGRIPISEALHYSMILAESLRRLHDTGKSHGSVSPTHVALNGTGVELIAPLGPSEAVTPYTAPELLTGGTADTRGDIFSFGALVYEMLTGRRAFAGENQDELRQALTSSMPASSGSPAVDRLVAGCVAKDPAARWQRIQKIMLELKLLTVAARRADAAPRGAAEAALRSEMQQVEARLTARLSQQEQAAAEARTAVAETLHSLREQLATLGADVSALQARPEPVPVDVDALTARIHARMDQTADAVIRQLTAASEERAGSIHHGLDEVRKQFAALQSSVANDLRDLEQTLKTHTVAIDSARTAMAQTDDLVERVVEALELLQSSVLDQHEPAVVN